MDTLNLFGNLKDLRVTPKWWCISIIASPNQFSRVKEGEVKKEQEVKQWTFLTPSPMVLCLLQ